jgi:hypothetical protein
MSTFRLRVGFPETVPLPEGLLQAMGEWREACERAGYAPVGDPSVLVVTDDPDRMALGEYAVDVVGERTGDGDV